MKKKQSKNTPSKEEEVFTREDFLNFLKKVSRPVPTKKQDGKSSVKEKSKTSE